jgi:hypothetical protein
MDVEWLHIQRLGWNDRTFGTFDGKRVNERQRRKYDRYRDEETVIHR